MVRGRSQPSLIWLIDTSEYLPWAVFHFQLSDLLYMHDSLRPNVDAFLADLFLFFEAADNQGTPR